MTLQEENDNIELIANAIQRGEEEIVFSASGTQHHTYLPTPQRAGTMTQQRCYAVDKARVIIEGANLWQGIGGLKIKSKEDTIRVKVYKSRVLRGGFRCPETDNEYSPMWPKKFIYSEDAPVVINTGVFSREWCCEAQKAIIDENSDIYEATGRFSWGSGDEVSMPSKYYKLNTKTVR